MGEGQIIIVNTINQKICLTPVEFKQSAFRGECLQMFHDIK